MKMNLSENEVLDVVKEYGSKALYKALYAKYNKNMNIGYIKDSILYFADDLTWRQTKMLLKVLNKVYSNSISYWNAALLKQWEEHSI
jgi:hypothetical protein